MGNISFSFGESNIGHAVSSLPSQTEGMATGCSSQGLTGFCRAVSQHGIDGYFSLTLDLIIPPTGVLLKN